MIRRLLAPALVAVVAAALSPISTSSAPASAATTSTSPWAVASSYGSSLQPSTWSSAVAGLGVGTVRGFDQDTGIGAGTQVKAGLKVTGILQWSPSGSALSFPVANLTGWQSYVKQMVTANPQVTDWEVWNEPPNYSVSQSPADYATIVKAAYTTAKSVNSAVRIGLTAKATDLRWLDQAITSGAARYFDFITVHPYERAGIVSTTTDDLPTGGEQGFMSIVPEVRAMLAADDPSQASVPIRFSEYSVAADGSNAASLQAQAGALVKTMTMSVAQGVDQVAWFDPWDGDTSSTASQVYGLFDSSMTVRPAGTAYARLISALGKNPKYLGWAATADGGLGFCFDTGSTTTMVAWSRDGDGASISLGGNVTATDPVSGATSNGGTVALTRMPKIIVATGSGSATLRVLAAANAAKPFGTVTAADSANITKQVSLTRTNYRNGIEIFAGLKACTLAGVDAFCAKDQGPSFAISPSFAGWTGKNLTLTIVMRGVSGNPGFGVKFDSALPYSQLDWAGDTSTGSWNYVSSDSWQTKTWTLTNFSLSGKYGFNLRLDSDSSVYSSFAIKSITITKS